MIKANKTRVEFSGALQTITAEMIAVIREYVALVDRELDGDPHREALNAIRIYENWVAAKMS